MTKPILTASMLMMVLMASASVQGSEEGALRDFDSDGVADSIENGAPGNGDGNRDGQLDSTQRGVASLEYSGTTGIEGSTNQATIESIDTGQPKPASGFSNVRFLPWGKLGTQPMSSIPPLQFQVSGGSVQVHIEYHGVVFPRAGQFQWRAAQNGEWIDGTESAERVGSGWTVSVVDNGPQDLDSRVGMISVIGFPTY